MLKNYSQTKKYLYSLIPPEHSKRKYPGEIGLLRMKSLLAKLDNPQQKFSSVHIAGTAGKGSTSYLIARIIQEAGYKVGLHTSPHLQEMTERVQINGKLISKKDFTGLINKVCPQVEKMKTGKWGRPSYFEVLTAAAFLYFAGQKVDLAVIEVGMGGRFDGTNVLNSLVSVITNIGLDHTNILGKTKDEILKDKMQIVKSGCLAVVTGITQLGLLKILKKHCREKKTEINILGRDFQAGNTVFRKEKSSFDFIKKHPSSLGKTKSSSEIIRGIQLNMPGAYQVNNAALAIAVCQVLSKKSAFKTNNKQIRSAFHKPFFPGRMEIVSKRPLIILDGAHNEDKTKTLVKSIKEVYDNKKFAVVFGAKRDKDVVKMLSSLADIADFLVITQFGRETDLGFKMNYEARDLYGKAVSIFSIIPGSSRDIRSRLGKSQICLEPDLRKAIEKAQALIDAKLNPVKKQTEKGILVTGSLYLVGEARKIFGLSFF